MKSAVAARHKSVKGVVSWGPPPPTSNCAFLKSYKHRARVYKNEDVLVVGNMGKLADLLRIDIRTGKNKVERTVTVEESKTFGDALVRIINGEMTYGVIVCPFDRSFPAWVRDGGYEGVIVAVDSNAPLQEALLCGYDAAVRFMDDQAMRHMMLLMRDVIQARSVSEVGVEVAPA